MAVAETEPKTLLLGGGYTLQRVAERLPPGSFVITSRSAAQCEQWRARGWEAFAVSIDDISALRALFARYRELRVLVDSVPPLRALGDDTEQATQGVHNVSQLLSSTGIERVVYLSTTGVFGVRDGSWVDESTPPTPWNSQGLARQLCEDVYALAAKTSGRLTFTTLRLPAIYGPDRGVAVSLRNGTYSMVGDGSQWTNRIHVDDLAEVVVQCIGYQGVLPPVICVNDDCPTEARDVVSYICEREGLAWPTSISPEEVLRRGGYTMLSNQRVRNTLMKSVLGVSLRYPSYREGVAVGE